MSVAASYLELLQKNHLSLISPHGSIDPHHPLYDDLFDDLAKLDPALAQAVRPEHRNRLEQAFAERPSRYQDASTYAILTQLANQVEETATAAGLHLPPRPVFGTLPLGQFNAMAVRVPRTQEHIIVFQDGVFGFLNLLSKAVAASFPETEGEGQNVTFSVHPLDIDAHLDKNTKPTLRFQQFLDAYVLEGHPLSAEQYFLTGPHLHLASLMCSSAELFVMGHEYAHVIRGHLSEEHVPHSGLGDDVEILSRRYEQEFEADILGLKLSVESMVRGAGVDVALSFFGVHLLFSAIEMVDRAIETLVPGFAPSSSEHETHPIPGMRRGYLGIYLSQGVGEEAGGAAVALGEQVDYILDALWARSEDHYARLRSAGAEPSPIWLL